MANITMLDGPVPALPATNARFAPLCVDPSQISVLTPGQDGPETLDAYIQRMVREEVRRSAHDHQNESAKESALPS